MLLYSGSMESKAYTETQIKLYIPGFTLCPTYQITEQIALRLDTKFLQATENILKGESWDVQFNLGLGIRF